MMKSFTRALAVATILTGFAATAEAAEPMQFTLDNGYTFVGKVDDRTDEDQLWVWFGGGTTVVLRHVGWDHVTAIKQQGRDITRQEVIRFVSDQGEAPANDGPTDAERARQWLGF